MARATNSVQVATDVWASSSRTLTAGSYSVVKTVQYFTITYASGGTSATATLSQAVDTTKTFLCFLGETVTSGAGQFTDMAVSSTLVLTNTTTVTANRNAGTDEGGGNVTGTVKGCAVEFY